MNWFMILLIVLQSFAGGHYCFSGKYLLGILMILYGICNVVLFAIGETNAK